MGLKNFKTYQLAIQFHKGCEQVKAPKHLREQLSRASSSIVLNIAEGTAKPTVSDQKRYYAIALGSLRESQAVLDLLDLELQGLANIGDQLGSCLFTLVHREYGPAVNQLTAKWILKAPAGCHSSSRK